MIKVVFVFELVPVKQLASAQAVLSPHPSRESLVVHVLDSCRASQNEEVHHACGVPVNAGLGFCLTIAYAEHAMLLSG